MHHVVVYLSDRQALPGGKEGWWGTPFIAVVVVVQLHSLAQLVILVEHNSNDKTECL